MKFFTNLFPNGSRDTRSSGQADLVFGHVKVGFVEREWLDEIGMTLEYLARSTRGNFIADKVGRYKDRVRTQPFGANCRHRRAHAKFPCLIRSRADNRAMPLPCNHDRSAAQLRI